MEATFAGIALTGPTHYETLESWETPTTAEVDVVLPCRGKHADPIPMGNRATPVTLRFHRDHGTYEQATIFAAGLAASLPDQGPLVLRSVGAGLESLIVYPAACFKSCKPTIDLTLSVLVELQFLTGAPAVVTTNAVPEVTSTWDTCELNWEDIDFLWDQEIPVS